MCNNLVPHAYNIAAMTVTRPNLIETRNGKEKRGTLLTNNNRIIYSVAETAWSNIREIKSTAFALYVDDWGTSGT